MRGALRRGEGGDEDWYNSAGRVTNWNGRVPGDTHMETWSQPTASKRLSTHNPARRLAVSSAPRLTESTLHGSDKA